LFVVWVPAAGAAQSSTSTIDFSDAGQGPFDQSFFRSSGARFSEGSFVGYVQGDDALLGPVAGSIRSKFTRLSASFAPTVQGTAEYTLTAFARAGREIASNSVTVTQDTGDPASGPFGYVVIDLGPLASKASSFRLHNRFIRSSFSHISQIDFGVAAFTWTG
jgi:hypothetical protein